jgi:hypothetical protein
MSVTRLATIALAALTAVLQVAVVMVTELRLDTASLAAFGVEVGPGWSRIALASVWGAPWAAGAALLAIGRPRVGTAVVVTSAVLSLGRAGGVIAAVSGMVGDGGEASTWLFAGSAVVVWVMGVAAAVTAWLGRPRDGWRDSAPGPTGPYTAAAVLAWLPTAFTTTAFAPPGVPRRFLERTVSELDLVTFPSAVFPVAFALVLFAAPRFSPSVASAIVLSFALPQSTFLTEALVATLGDPDTIPTPSGVLGAIGTVALVVIAVRWWLVSERDRR